jgi:hypothetical protein
MKRTQVAIATVCLTGLHEHAEAGIKELKTIFYS